MLFLKLILCFFVHILSFRQGYIRNEVSLLRQFHVLASVSVKYVFLRASAFPSLKSLLIQAEIFTIGLFFCLLDDDFRWFKVVVKMLSPASLDLALENCT